MIENILQTLVSVFYLCLPLISVFWLREKYYAAKTAKNQYKTSLMILTKVKESDEINVFKHEVELND